MTYTILVVVQVVVALALIGLILVQHGKGADAGAAFGSGASGTVFGAQGSSNFLSHTTAALAVVFFCLSLALAYLVGGHPTQPTGASVTEQLQQSQPSIQLPQDNTEPATPAARGASEANQTQTQKPETPTFDTSDAAQSGQKNDTKGENQGITAQIPE